MKYKSAYPQLLNTVKSSNNVMKTMTAILLLATFLYGCADQSPQTAAPPAPPALPVASVIAGTETTFQEYPASIEGTVNVEVRPQISGALEKVFVDEGAFVSAGQPIFKINEQPYRVTKYLST